MRGQVKISLTAISALLSIVLVSCVPTSVLVNTKESKLNNSKGKGPTLFSSPTTQKSAPDLHGAAVKEKPLGILQGGFGVFGTKAAPKKRGVSQLMYGDIYNNLPTGPVPNGVWENDVESSDLYSDLPDFDDYPRGSYRSKYENLQNILNSKSYPDPVAPVQHPYRYYGDRKKRSNKNLPYDIRLKRESKLTPADMLALVALVEAGERSRQDAQNGGNDNDYLQPFYTPYNRATEFDNEILNSWVDPAVDYYGMPYSLDDIPPYDMVKGQRLRPTHYTTKRYMVAEKKGSLGHFINEPVDIPSISHEGYFPETDLILTGPRRYQTFF